jgi:hypothetical protein
MRDGRDDPPGTEARRIRSFAQQVVPMVCIPRPTVYYKATKPLAKVQERFVPMKEAIKQNPSFGYRTVACLPEFNKNTVQRIFQHKDWQVRKRPVGTRPQVAE